MNITKANNYEMHKPSEMCQIVFFENYKKGVFAYLTPTQLDLLNIVYYVSYNKLKNKTDKFEKIVSVELDLNDIIMMMDSKYKSDNKALLGYLYDLKSVDVIINTLGKVKDTVNYELTSIIHTIKWSEHRRIIDKTITLGLDGDILSTFFRRDAYFVKMFLSIQLKLKSKYSKLLYEILRDYLGRDYKGVDTIEIDFGVLLALLNVDFENTRNSEWAMFNQNVLKKAQKEINEKTDIIIEYEPIKEKVDNKKQVVKVKFNMQSQNNDRLLELGVIEDPETVKKKEIIAQERLLKMKNYKSIDNEQNWLRKTMKSITPEDIMQYDVRNSKLESIEVAKKELDMIDITDYMEVLRLKYSDHVQIVDYKLQYLFEMDPDNFLTKNALETLEVIKEIQNE